MTNTELTPHQQAERKAAIIEAYNSGKSFTECGEQFGISRQWAHTIYWQAVAEVPQLAVHELRSQQNVRLDGLIERTQEVMDRAHVVTSGGKIVRGEDGKPLRDSMPELRAIEAQARLLEQQARLNGLNAPAQVTVNGEIKYEIVGVDMEALR